MIGLSYEGESMMKFYVWTPLLRLYWMSAEEDVCLSHCEDVVNSFYQNTIVDIVDGCVGAIELQNTSQVAVSVIPNPITSSAQITFSNPMRDELILMILDASGREVRRELVNGTDHVIEKGELSSGAYFFTVYGNRISPMSGRFDIQ